MKNETGSSILIDLHCHSSLSDGVFTPEKVAQCCADAHVEWAALADHNTLDGQQAFHTAVAAHSIGYVSAVEISCLCGVYDLHILGYGFNCSAKEITNVIDKYKYGTAAVQGRVEVVTSALAIEAIHAAGGIAVVAHPLLAEENPELLVGLIDELRREGIDGIEINGNAGEHAEVLAAYADKNELCVAMGTDFHGDGKRGPLVPGISCPTVRWKKFRDSLLGAARGHDTAYTLTDKTTVATNSGTLSKKHWFSFFVHIVTPVITVMALFVGALFYVVLPMFENALIERKREMIRELTNSAISILDDAYRRSTTGEFSEVQAQRFAASQVSRLRYGTNGKDYFWIQDCTPKMIMHPYRHDLDGKDLSKVTDRNGVYIFNEFAALVKEHEDGYMQYVWQWMDDSLRIEPKESYLRLFRKWQWIVGTGIYLHDVHEEIRRYRGHLTLICASIGFCALCLLLYALRRILHLEKRRLRAETSLAEATERYRLLVDAATEGALFIYGNRCRYANAAMMTYIGCTEQTIELFHVDDLFPLLPENRQLHEYVASKDVSAINGDSFRGKMLRADGTLVECIVILKVIPGATDNSRMILVRHLEQNSSISRNWSDEVMLEKLLKIPLRVPDSIISKINRASNVDAVVVECRKTPALVRALLDNGASPMAVAAMLSNVGTTAAKRLSDLAFNKFGGAPVPFTFCVLGSQGRMEQTLFTDQDSIIIYDAQGEDAVAAEYFTKWSAFVCGGLLKCGYRACGGEVMATNSRWCQPLSVWQGYFDRWITSATSHELMEFSAFFDFKAVIGEARIAHSLRQHIFSVLEKSTWFYHVFAQNALEFKAPLRLFGNVVTQALPKAQQGKLDLKAIAMPIVSFMRLYALKNGLGETNTIERLDALTVKGLFLESKRQDIAATWEALLRFRLRHQVETVEKGEPIDNCIDPLWLGHIGEAVLRECFKEIDSLQNRIRHDFLADG